MPKTIPAWTKDLPDWAKDLAVRIRNARPKVGYAGYPDWVKPEVIAVAKHQFAIDSNATPQSVANALKIAPRTMRVWLGIIQPDQPKVKRRPGRPRKERAFRVTFTNDHGLTALDCTTIEKALEEYKRQLANPGASDVQLWEKRPVKVVQMVQLVE